MKPCCCSGCPISEGGTIRCSMMRSELPVDLM